MADTFTQSSLGSATDAPGIAAAADEKPTSLPPVGITTVGRDTEKRKSPDVNRETAKKRSIVVPQGLEVIAGDDNMPVRYFTYGIPSGIVCINPLTEKLIVLEVEVKNDHVLVLRQGFSEAGNKHTKALVVINNKNSLVLEYDIPKEMTIPILVIKQLDGKDLLEILRGSGKYLCNIKAESTVDRCESEQDVVTHQPQARTNKEWKGDYTTLLLRMLFENDKPVLISENSSSLFPAIMSTLYNYEQGKPEPEDLKVVLQKMNTHMEFNFSSDFPFFIILAYIFHLKLGYKYHSTEGTNFIKTCIELMETRPSSVIAERLNRFVNGEDSEVELKDVKGNKFSKYSLFETACTHLCEISLAKRQSLDKLNDEFIHKKMLWVSLAVKVKSKISHEKIDVLWKNHFARNRCQLLMNDKLVDSLKSGVEFWEMIGLPKDFIGRLISDIVVLYYKELCFFQYLRCFISKLQIYLSDKDIQVILTNIRSIYHSRLNDAEGYRLCSKKGTLVGALEEGIGFLNCVKDVWSERTSKNINQIEEELLKWVELLLKCIDVTSGQAVKQLEIVLHDKGVGKKFSRTIINTVITMVRNGFSKLTIKLFVPLYGSFEIWPTNFVVDYLQQQRLKYGMKITNKEWIKLFQTVSKRFTEENSQYFIIKFLYSVGVAYEEDDRAEMFISDLLTLDVDGFLSQEGKVVEEEDRDDFKRFLQNYIKNNCLCNSLLHDIIGLMDLLSSEKDGLQELVLAAVKEEVVPDYRHKWRCAPDGAAEAIIEKSLKELCQNFNWEVAAVSTKQSFCWGVVARFCVKVPLEGDHLQWLKENLYIVNQLCRISGEHFKVMHKYKPSMPDLQEYLEWVNKVKTLIVSLHQRLLKKEFNYDEIIMFIEIQREVRSIAKGLCISADLHLLEGQRTEFCESFEQLNIIMLKSVPAVSKGTWCTLPSLLVTNGVSFSTELSDVLTKYILIPGESNKRIGRMLENEPPVSTTGKFTLGTDVSLKLSKQLHLKKLQQVVDDLQEFLQPLLEHLEMLVFFNLQKSILFLTYNKVHLEKVSNESIVNDRGTYPKSIFFSLPGIMSANQEDKTSSKEMNVLVKALALTESILIKLNAGEATYNEITAEGKIDLTMFNVDTELKVLNEYIIHYKPTLKSESRLSGVRNMLELFQYTDKIFMIHKVCEQFQLQGCLGDKSLIQLIRISEDHAPRQRREVLTINDATDTLKIVKYLLFEKQDEDSGCLKLFDAVADCKAFHQFLKDRQFVGDQGSEVFYQQFNLITAQLQHEEYDEQVLNHLCAAFPLMFPFMDTNQNFQTLMKSVIKLNTTNGFKQLYTVNSNIFIIQMWFSRAEGDTLHNVANQLEGIIKTGSYIFKQSGSSLGITLEYVPTTRLAAHHLLSPVEGTEDTTLRKKWTYEQIHDFVLKLGFMDTKGTCAGKIKHFLHINEVANKLLNLHICLKDLGHPKFLTPSEKPLLECNDTLEAADKKFIGAQATLTSWTTTVTRLRSQYILLLFVTVPKLLKLFKLIQQYKMEHLREENDEDEKSNCGAESEKVTIVIELVNEIMFLICKDQSSRERLSGKIQTHLSKGFINIKNAMEVVGGFLHNVLENETLPRRCRNFDHDNHTAKLQGVGSTKQILHHAPNYRQSQLVRLIISICNGIPESFEVFHCRSSSTKEELRLFLDRINKHPLRYLLLEVNILPVMLQEYLMQWCIKTHHQGRSMDQQLSSLAITKTRTIVHFVETASSTLRELPWIILKEYEDNGPAMLIDAAKMVYKEVVKDFASIYLVYGKAGDGKTHYIKRQLQDSSSSVTISVNEAFAPVGAIKKLRTLPSTEENCGVFFNFTMIPPGENVDEREVKQYKELMKVISWFFFDLLLLGYVEDPVTGLSVCIGCGMGWKIYVEVPSQIGSVTPEGSLTNLIEEIPMLGIVSEICLVDKNTEYTIDGDVQLVCKYLNAYQTYKDKGHGGINRLSSGSDLPKFSTHSDLSPQRCYKLLKKTWKHFFDLSKVKQKLFIKYMKRRCDFLEVTPAFYLNTGVGEYVFNPVTNKKETSDTRQLGSTLMETMLKEAKDFCSLVKHNWLNEPHQQLIYDEQDRGGSIGLLSLNPDELPIEDVTKFEKIGVEIPSMEELHQRPTLEDYLSRAFSFKVKEIIDHFNYVLTLDFTIKMLNIHERKLCGVPVIIEGETGVGKTALVEMLSNLWNHSILNEIKIKKDRILDFMTKKLQKLAETDSIDMTCIKCVEDISAGIAVNEDDLFKICCLADTTSLTGYFYTTLQSELNKMRGDPSLLLLTAKTKGHMPLTEYFTQYSEVNSAQATATLLHAVLLSEAESTFHKINVHAALTPQQIWRYLKPAIEQANFLMKPFDCGEKKIQLQHSLVTVFLDEVNTSSCLGLFKELIVDRTFDGEPIPENIFIIAACNPHRGDSLAIHRKSSDTVDDWTRSSYYVRQLHQTLELLKWDYGSLDEKQEKHYIDAKLRMLNKEIAGVYIEDLTVMISESQNLMRTYVSQHLCQFHKKKSQEASKEAWSCVSQRDIQRVFVVYQWLQKLYKVSMHHGQHGDYTRRAVLVSLGVVYYMRLNTKYRDAYKKEMDEKTFSELNFSAAFQEEIKWFMDNIQLPSGIARTQALMENIFATIVCTCTHTPLIIVGAPGSSKTLSFNLVIANLKGQQSEVDVFKNTDIFHSLDPHFYQCSRQTTSNEIETVFSRAINRQQSHVRFTLPIYCVVFMDEAGLPEESHESLKVLHYHLDRQEVSFVAITNHMLDAAKSNRGVCVFRPEATKEDLRKLSAECFSSNMDSLQPILKEDLKLVENFSSAFYELMQKKGSAFRHFFGLRDFIHFTNYLRRKRDQILKKQVVMEAIERNFNGFEQFDEITSDFLKAMGIDQDIVCKRSVLDVLKESLHDHPVDRKHFSENEVRYKLIIDPSEDGSIIPLLFSLGVLDRNSTRVYICSDFPGEVQTQKVNLIAAIRHSAIEGHTVLMSQTDSVHESFYDLFNQRFRRIDDPHEGPRYYTNIAIGAHSRPCRIHPHFQCVVVVKQSKIKETPAPFLNRFEKYCITHDTLLKGALAPLPTCLRRMLLAAKEKVKAFVQHIAKSGFYGFHQSDTIDSLILCILPPADYKFLCNRLEMPPDSEEDIEVYQMKLSLKYLKENLGFRVPCISAEELKADTEAVFAIAKCDSEFCEDINKMNHENDFIRAEKAVYEAISVLLNTTEVEIDGKNHLHISTEGCIVVQVLQQWLVHHLVKRLMQLMTAEAFIDCRFKLPLSYLKDFLDVQVHFSLRDLIKLYLGPKWTTKPHTSKLLCFTRSSSLIYELPAQYPNQVVEQESKDDLNQTLKSLVHDKVEELIICKLSSIPSQHNMLDLLHIFTTSPIAKVLVLVINVHEVKREVVNHIRTLIEEEEVSYVKDSGGKKLFALLLHFPPSTFGRECYPSLFLQGWDHYYLDTIGQKNKSGLDIQRWFQESYCFHDTCLPSSKDPLLTTLTDFLDEAIPILTSRLHFGFVKGAVFNIKMKVSKRRELLRELLLKKGLGNALCERFRSYWKPHTMFKYLKEAAIIAKTPNSTLNVTDSIHTTLKNFFFDFLVCMVYRINRDCNIDVLFLNTSWETQELFLNIVKLLPLPKLSELKVHSSHCQVTNRVTSPPHFPFFKLVSEKMKTIVEESHLKVNINLIGDLETAETEHTICFTERQHYDIEHQKVVLQEIKELISKKQGSNFLACSLKSLDESPKLWEYYFKDFIVQALHLETSDGISKKMLEASFHQHHQNMDVLEKFTHLHVYVTLLHPEMAKMANILRSLDQIQSTSMSINNSHAPSIPSPTDTFVTVVQKTHGQESCADLSKFVIDILFNTLSSAACLQASSSSQEQVDHNSMLVWYEAYRDLMCLPELKKHVYSSFKSSNSTMVAVEARFTVMHTVFLVVHSGFSRPEQLQTFLVLSQKVFHTLFKEHFRTSMDLKAHCPRLESVATVVMNELSQSDLEHTKIRLLMEGLFSHFFSAYRPNYHTKDVQWFLELANHQYNWCTHVGDISRQTPMTEVQTSIYERVPKGCITISIFKMYLSQILGKFKNDTSQLNPLALYENTPRIEVGKVIVRKTHPGEPTSYIPTFFQVCHSTQLPPSSKRMQQPLAHLYFLTVLEHMLNRQKTFPAVVSIAIKLSNECCSEVSESMKVVMQIEYQAVLQVIAKQIAAVVERSETDTLTDTIKAINRLFSKVEMENCMKYGMVVGLHLLRNLRSSRKFVELMTLKYDTRCNTINFLKSIHDKLKVKPAQHTFHFFPWMSTEGNDDLSKLYQKIKYAMLRIVDEKPNAKQDLETLATKCLLTHAVPGKSAYNCSNFKMMMWLAIFYEFFDKKKTSPALCKIFGDERFSQLANLGGHEIRLFRSFLDKTNIIAASEDPDPLRHDEEVLELLPGGGHQRKERKGAPSKVDPLFELFFPPSSSPPDQSDEDLRYALANMVAVILGCKPQSNHLWYHLFNQQPLWNTYLTGFMYKSKVTKDGLLYDCGVVLSPEGEFGRPDYNQHANRGTYNLHSLYLILFVNFGSFCIAMLTQPDAQKNIHGPLISRWLSVRHYCVSQLRSIWLHIRNNLGISAEERSFLIMKCMMRFYKVFSNEGNVDHPGGIFSTIEQLDSYEKVWHSKIYMPSYEGLMEEFTHVQHPVFVEIRNLESQYPCFPTEKDFTHSVLTFQETGTNDINFITQFSLQWQRLQTGGKLLPDIVEFYMWLHTELAYVICYQRACEVTIGNLVKRIAQKYPTDMGDNFKQLYARVKEGYNKYVELIGGSIGVGACAAARRGNTIRTIEDRTSLLLFLSGEEEAENDLLFIVINDIVNAHNTMLNLPRQLVAQPFLKLLPNKQAEVFPTEITADHSIVPHVENHHGITELLQLIRSRQKNVLNPKPSVLQDVNSVPVFHLDMLQEDIISCFIANKPFIRDLFTLRTPFQFKASAPKHLLYPQSIISLDEIADIKLSLGELLTKHMDEGRLKHLEFEFHTAGYYVMLHTTTGLKTAAGYLVKSVSDVGRAFTRTWTFGDFLLSQYDGPHSVTDILSDIGIRQLTETQIKCLLDLPVANLYHCLQVFSNWMDTCVYDFSTLPYTLKSHLQQSDLSTLKALPQTWKEPMIELQNAVNDLNEQLSNAEAFIINQNTGHSIIAYLRELNVLCEDDQLPNYIPKTILIRHYVQFRIILREVLREVQRRVDQQGEENGATERDSEQWDDTVEDIWEKYLSNFRGIQYTGDGLFLYDVAKCRYQYEIESDSEEDLIGTGDKDDEDEVEERPGAKFRGGIELKEEICEGEIIDFTGQQVAAEITVQQVADFIRAIGLGQYAEFFIEDEMDGEMMLAASDNDLPDKVESRLHRVKIITLFKSTFVRTTKQSLSVDDVGRFLKAEKLDEFVDVFNENAIDCDILEAIIERNDAVDGTGGMTVADLILKEDLGIQKGPQRLKIKTKFKRFRGSLAKVPSTH